MLSEKKTPTVSNRGLKSEQLLHQDHPLRLHEISGHEAVEIDAARQAFGIPPDGVLAGMFLLLDEPCNFSTEQVKDRERDIAFPGH